MTIQADIATMVRSLPDDAICRLLGPVVLSHAQEVLATVGKQIVLKRPHTIAERDCLEWLGRGACGAASLHACTSHPRKTIENTLTRLKKQGRVVNRDGVWSLVR